MPLRQLDRNNPGDDADWEGNNAAFTCPKCKNVFIVSELLHRSANGVFGQRACRRCAQSTARVSGGRKSGGTASIEWTP